MGESLKFLSTFYLLQLFSEERFLKNGKLAKLVSLSSKKLKDWPYLEDQQIDCFCGADLASECNYLVFVQ